MIAPKRRIFMSPAIAALAFCLGLAFSSPAFCAKPPAKLSNDLGMEFVLIPAGSFIMGSPDSEPGRQDDERAHRVTISKPFYMQTTEVTLAQWRQVMGKKLFGRRRGGKHAPVTRVSWFEAMKFVKAMNKLGMGTYRLPTEAQWEYAARAGTKTAYWWGARITCDKAMFANAPGERDDCAGSYRLRGLKTGRPAPVGSFAANPWGLSDTSGNVWEWCSDWYAPYPKGPVTDPKGPAKGTYRVRRGGSWFSSGSRLRSANRNFGHPAMHESTLGLRLVREPD